MSQRFPAVRSADEFDRVRRDDARLRPGVLAVCEGLGLGGAAIRRFAGGSLPVYAVDDSLVLKLYPPFDLAERDREAAALRAIAGRLPVPTPELRAAGGLEGWGYLLMTRLRGEPLATAWPRIPDAGRLRLAAGLGTALAALHSIDGPDLDAARFDWRGFLAEQRDTAVERQARHGLEQRWLVQIPEFLDSTPLGEPLAGSLLHTEVMREHLLVEHGRSGWKFSGLFDLEPAMVGAPEYEFASVGLFFSCGEARILRRVLRSYGYRERELGGELERRLMAYALLHRYSNLPWWLDRLPPGRGATTLRALASCWWGTGSSSSRRSRE